MTVAIGCKASNERPGIHKRDDPREDGQHVSELPAPKTETSEKLGDVETETKNAQSGGTVDLWLTSMLGTNDRRRR